VREREGTNLDMSMCSLIALWMRTKEIPKLLQARRLQNLCKRICRNRKHWHTDDGIDGLRINLNGVPLNSGLKYNPTVIILNDL
jgi:hypothetical protein